MMRGFLAFWAAVALLTGCAPKPSEEDLKAVLAQNVAQPLKSSVAMEQIQTESSSSGDDQLVKFKSILKTSEPLFAPVEFESAAKSVGGNEALFGQIDSAAQALSPDARSRFAADVAKATEKPTFIAVATPAGTTSDWYGSFKVRKVVDKWLSSDFKTEVESKLAGQPRASFPANAIDVATAKAWFADLQPKQEALLQRLADARSLEQKDAELVQQQAATQQERQAKESLLAADQRKARQLPLQVSFRHAALGGTQVLRIQALRPMTVRVDVTRGLQRFARDLQVAPGRIAELGHLQGWGFKFGDQINLSNPAFDAVSFVVR
jgi:hypothetical protein